MSTHVIKRGETAFGIAKEAGVTLAQIKALNPKVNLDKLQIGQELTVHAPETKKHEFSIENMDYTKKAKAANPYQSSIRTQQPSTFCTTPKAISSGSIMTQSNYNTSLSEEGKKLKPIIIKKEGKVLDTYIAPEGLATIGHGHLFINKPTFLKNIEAQKITPGAKNIKLKEALKNPANKTALKASIQQELEEAIKLTGIKDVPSTVSSDLKLTDAQVELLLNSDIKKAQNAMNKSIGKENLAKRTLNQKLAALDLYYNAGENLNKKAPNFVKQFKAGNMDKAQAELDIFRTDGKIQLGLIRRCYDRMLLLSDNNSISEEAKVKILKAYNEYCRDHNKMVAGNFSQIENKLKV